jgi:hypothetical protein
MAAIKKKKKSRVQTGDPLVVVNLDEAQAAAPASEGDPLPTDETDPRSPVAPITPASVTRSDSPAPLSEPGEPPFVSKMTPPPVADEVTQSEPPARVGSESAAWRNEAGGDWFDVGEDPSSFTDHLAEREAQSHRAGAGIPPGAKVVIGLVLLAALGLLVLWLASSAG